MPVKRKKIENNFEREVTAPKKGEAPSPYVLDLGKLMTDKNKIEEKSVVVKAKNKTASPEPVEAAKPEISQAFRSAVISAAKEGLGDKARKSFYSFNLRIKRVWWGAGGAAGRFFNFFRGASAEYKKIFSFGVVAFLFILPLQIFSYVGSLKNTESEAMQGVENAYASLLSGAGHISDSNFSAAAGQFDQAAGEFENAGGKIQEINSIVAGLIKAMPVGGDKFKAGEAITFAGEKLSWAGGRILQSLADFSEPDDQRTVTKKIEILRNRLAVILPEVTAAEESLSGVKLEAVPEDKRAAFAGLQNKLGSAVKSLRKIIMISDLMVKLLGDDYDKRYLFVFQNTAELRPTGGFMGSLALVDFDRGQIKNIEVPGGGPYDFNGSLEERIAAPEPLRLINSRWQFQDANWFPDFPSSAEKVKWFYEHGGGPTVDGVIAVNSDFVVDLLGAVGPIDMPEYGKTISSENFMDEIQASVEVEYDRKENKPKKIIGDMMPKLIDKVMSSDAKQMGKILSAAAGALQKKNIMVYSVFPTTEHEIISLGWGGEIKNAGESTDYLSVVNSNLGGQKTDRVIDENINLETTISDDGTVTDKLTIKRRHNGNKGDMFTGVRNVDFVRVYVPAGSALVRAAGFEAPPVDLFENPDPGYQTDADLKNKEGRLMIDAASGTRITSEFGKTVFGNWIQVDPGEEATVTLEYVLPFKIYFPEKERNFLSSISDYFTEVLPDKVFYQLLVQKQSGTKAAFSDKIIFPVSWQASWLYGDGATLGDAAINIAAPLSGDKFYLSGFVEK